MAAHQVKVKVKVMLQLTVSQSVCLGVEPQLGLMTRCFLFVTVAVLSIWGALSDERSGLSFVSHSQSIVSIYMAAHQRQLAYLYCTAVQLTSQSLSAPHFYGAQHPIRFRLLIR
jgi:hypothetical protein